MAFVPFTFALISLLGMGRLSEQWAWATDQKRCDETTERLLLGELAEIERVVDENDFNTRRSLDDYASMLGPALVGAVHSLRSTDHWIDAGAGQWIAQLQYRRWVWWKGQSLTSGWAAVTGVGLRRPEISERVSELREGARRPDGIEYVEAPIEGLSLEQLQNGPATLITDIYGPLSYSREPHRVLRSYIGLLREHGQILFRGMSNVQVYRPPELRVPGTSTGGRYMTLADWIETIPGIRLERLEEPEDYSESFELVPQALLFRITLASPRQEIHIPDLHLVRAISNSPPVLYFRQ